MTSPRITSIANSLTGWLARYVPPSHLRNAPKPRDAEADALLSTLLQFAPLAGFEAWTTQTLAELDKTMKTRAWPTVSELYTICQRRQAMVSTTLGTQFSADPVSIAAKRMNNGDSVDESWLFGSKSNDLIRNGLISQQTLARYQAFAR